jgi:hypothetical protein
VGAVTIRLEYAFLSSPFPPLSPSPPFPLLPLLSLLPASTPSAPSPPPFSPFSPSPLPPPYLNSLYDSALCFVCASLTRGPLRWHNRISELYRIHEQTHFESEKKFKTIQR